MNDANPQLDLSDPPKSWLFKSSSLGGSFRVYLPALVSMRLLGMARMLAFAWLILKTEYGLSRLALLLINLLSAVVRLGVPVGLERYTPSYEKAGQLAQFARRGIWLATGVTAALTLLVAAFSPWLYYPFFASDELAVQGASPAYLFRITLACLGVTLVLSIYFGVLGILRGLRMYRALSVMEVVHGVTFLLFGVGGLLVGGDLQWGAGQLAPLPGAALVLTVAYGASLLVTTVWIHLALVWHLRRWRSQQQPMTQSPVGLMRQLLRFGGYMSVVNVLWTLFSMFGLWFVNKRRADEAGLFALAGDLMQVVPWLAISVWPVAQNSAAHLWEQGRKSEAAHQLGQVFRLSGWPLWLLCAALVLCRSAIQHLVPSTRYAGLADLIPWLLAMHLWFAHLSLPVAHAYLLERSRLMLTAAIIGLAGYIGAAWFLEPTWHAMGVAQAGAIGTAMATLTLMWLVNRKTDLHEWLTLRDIPLMVSPVLLAAPSIWPVGGDWMLAALAVTVFVLISCTSLLWSPDDGETFRRYVTHSVRTVLGRPRRRA